MTVNRDRLARMLAPFPENERDIVLRRLSPALRRELQERWTFHAHGGQLEPAGGDWRVWVIRAGRGFGKTRAGAEWVTEVARRNKAARIALVGATAGDVRKVMIEGPSGLLQVARAHETLRWSAVKGEVHFPSGAIATVYSARAGEQLRGPEHHAAWCDELAKWRNGEVAWNNLMLGLRLGDEPKVLVTTTPRAVALFQRIVAGRTTMQTGGRSGDNPNVPAAFLEAIAEQFGASNFGRQEIDGELIGEVEGALWSRALLQQCRVAATAPVARVVVGVDPSVGGGEGDTCGIVVAALGTDDRGYVLADASLAAAPDRWAARVAEVAELHGADRVVAEANQGGKLVSEVLRAADRRLPVKLVHATRGKAARAEPVATLYASGRVHHVGMFPALEDELCGVMAGGRYEGPGRSPDRADALVWGLTELMLGKRARAGVRSLGVRGKSGRSTTDPVADATFLAPPAFAGGVWGGSSS